MPNMRVVALIFAVLAVVIFAAGCSAEDNISFSLIGATRTTYREFIEKVRERLRRRAQDVNGIPVLPQNTTVRDSERFLLVDLTDYDSQTITVAIDVVNVYVVAYRAGDQSYFLREIPDAALNTLFSGTLQHTLAFAGNYLDLERPTGGAAGDRRLIDLGPIALNSAIDGLRREQSVAKSLLVIIQMISEALRFRMIEARVRQSIHTGHDFRPDEAILRLETSWDALSTAVQTTPNGVFTRNVDLITATLNTVTVNSIQHPVMAGVALLLYNCARRSTTSSTRIRMPVDDVVGRLEHETDVGENALLSTTEDPMCHFEDCTTRISGREGLCADVRDGSDTDRTPIILYPCGEQSNQQWTFHLDGTVRSLGKCMTVNSYVPGSDVMIINCNIPVQDLIKWTISADGTITNPHTGLVLTAQKGDSGTTLTLETNIYSAGQGWRPVALHEPSRVASILGLNDMCLEAQANNEVWLEDCVQDKGTQQWRLYNDGTIRVNTDLTRCLTSDGHSSGVIIIIRNCEGWANQRWVFKNDGTILNPNAKLVMDVKMSDVTLKQIILFGPTGNPNQEWLSLIIS